MPELFQDKPVRRVVGLMSGTSVDGIDAALVEISGRRGNAVIRLCAYESTPYSEEIKKKIFRLFDPVTATVDKIGYMNFLLGELFAGAALGVIRKAGLKPDEVDLIGSHGQTVFHCPEVGKEDGYEIRYTVQIGEGAVIAARTGIPCVSDFRVADMAVGGQGAPLVPFTEYLMYRRPSQTVMLQNIGGIGNITVIPAGVDSSGVYAFDTGPGNMIIDGLMGELYGHGMRMDVNGRIAAAGAVDPDLLQVLKNEAYYSLKPPKTTGRELFGAEYAGRIARYIRENGVKKEDGIATVTYLTAWSIADAYDRHIRKAHQADSLILGGGGSYNETLVKHILSEMEGFGVHTCRQEDLGYSSDAKEAIAFAVLADFTAAGMGNSLPGVTGADSTSVMGKISLPPVRTGYVRTE